VKSFIISGCAQENESEKKIDVTYLHPARPLAPSRPLKIPAASIPPKPLAIVLPQYITATRGAISWGLYQELINRLFATLTFEIATIGTGTGNWPYSAPAKKGDSAKPSSTRTTMIPAKFWVAAAHMEMLPQMKMAIGM
jgi:hypothetical protein